MKTFKLKGLEIYTVAFKKEDAVLIFLINKMGVTSDDVEETNLETDPKNFGKIIKH